MGQGEHPHLYYDIYLALSLASHKVFQNSSTEKIPENFCGQKKSAKKSAHHLTMAISTGIIGLSFLSINLIIEVITHEKLYT